MKEMTDEKIIGGAFIAALGMLTITIGLTSFQNNGGMIVWLLPENHEVSDFCHSQGWESSRSWGVDGDYRCSRSPYSAYMGENKEYSGLVQNVGGKWRFVS